MRICFLQVSDCGHLQNDEDSKLKKVTCKTFFQKKVFVVFKGEMDKMTSGVCVFVCVCVCVCALSLVQLFATPWTVARQAILSMEFSRQEYWRGLPCPPPGAALAGRFFTTAPPGKP